ncbi:MAN5 [Acrasis kona]|uniref:MAN5 n=1 Tax=Acrasis kona TaxID=1008807 RepID=A0AAW2ZAF6_9EUKA
MHLLLCLVLLLIATASFGAKFSSGPSLDGDKFGLFKRIDIGFNLANDYNNKYDPGQIDVSADFVAPDGKQTNLPCFWGTVDGRSRWLCRFSASQVGRWSFTLTAKDHSGSDKVQGSFEAVASNKPGYVRVSSKDHKYFVRSHDQSNIWPIGENIAWSDSNKGDDWFNNYQNWMSKLKSAGGNFIRIWTQLWHFQIEQHVGNYESSQWNHQSIDKIIQWCDDNGFTVLFSMNWHGHFGGANSQDWDGSPYNKRNGGPLSDPDQVWVNQEAIQFMERRLRYQIARWGWSASIHAWEMWNEQDHLKKFTSYIEAAGKWHQHFAQFVKKVDPYGHLITTSFSDWNPNWSKTTDWAMDFNQFHSYSDPWKDFLGSFVYVNLPGRVQQFNKPYFVGEFGPSYKDPNWKGLEDPNGWILHNEMWGSMACGAGGSGFTWWWQNWVEPKNLYYRFTGIANFMKSQRLDGLSPIEPQINNGGIRSKAVSGSGITLGWAQSREHVWGNARYGGGTKTFYGVSVRVPCSMSQRNNTVEIWDTIGGRITNSWRAECRTGSLDVSLPNFENGHFDWAYKVYPGGSGPVPPPPPPAPTPSHKKKDWQQCEHSSECESNCCSTKWSEGVLKCNPAGSTQECV